MHESGIVGEEERDRAVIGLTAANKCLVLAQTVDNAMVEMGGATEETAISLLNKGSYMQGWCPGLLYWHAMDGMGACCHDTSASSCSPCWVHVAHVVMSCPHVAMSILLWYHVLISCCNNISAMFS